MIKKRIKKMDWVGLSKLLSAELGFEVKLEEDEEIGAVFDLEKLNDGVYVHTIEATKLYTPDTEEYHSAVYYVKERVDGTVTTNQLFTAYYSPKKDRWRFFSAMKDPKIDYFSTYREKLKS